MTGVWARGAVLSVALAISGVQAALAHGLPGSELRLSQMEGQLQIVVVLPVEDLAKAAPSLQGLVGLTSDQAIPADVAARVDAYFTAHLSVTQTSGGLPLSLVSASIGVGESHDVGTFGELRLVLSAPLIDGDVFPLTLAYDAVMHEVRNHRATVYWAEIGTTPRPMAAFGFQGTNSVLLERP